MSDIQLFSSDDFELSIEYIGDTFRVYAPHLAKQLAFADARDMLRGLDDDEKVQVAAHGTTAVRPDQRVWWVTEAGLYRVAGQRKLGWIKDPKVREGVRRFQRWLYHDVLPNIRKHGGYQVTEPNALTWEQSAKWLDQRYGLRLSVGQITSALRAAGVLRQNGNPTAKYQDWFWMTSTGAVNVLDFVLPKIAAKITETRSKMLERQQWYQLRLQLDPAS